ncbi:MAG: ABC transporter substrate-binding protein [Betaproteobacteria bacterium RIFCSPLOWO2_12_FULL_65_14]|nr:MAG: ABC transporter substrate-binding protein [Betaproteobacteria bacterium RIFCSPLOWO2_12_FULL_65_14]
MKWLLALITIVVSGVAIAQPYPSKPVRLIVTFPPGGSTDTIARIFAPRLGERLGQPVVIDNRPGAGGAIGIDATLKSPADGYSIVLAAAGALTIIVHFPNRPAYDPAKDLAPITMIGTSPFLLVSQNDTTVKEVIEKAKASPGKLSYASGGNGTAMHLSGEMFKLMAGIDLLHIPFKGSGPAVTAAAQGQPPLAFADITSALPLLKSGRVKAVAVLSKERSSFLPEVPTLAESGVPGYEAIGWFGLLAPAGTPAPVVSRLAAETAAVMRQPDTREKLAAAALEPWVNTPEEFLTFIRAETAKWGRVIRESGAKLE